MPLPSARAETAAHREEQPMTEQPRASSLNLSRFFTRINAPIAWLLKSPLRFLLDGQLMLVTVTGRKSGKRFTIPVGYQRRGDQIVVLVSRKYTKQWWRNYRTPWPITVFTRGESHEGTAEVVPEDSPEFAAAFQATFDQMPWLAPQFGVRDIRGRRLDAEDHSVLAKEGAVVRIELS
jgi:hypothetical protein